MMQRELNSCCSNKTHMWIIKQRQAKMTNLKIQESEDHIDCKKVFFLIIIKKNTYFLRFVDK